LRPPGQSIKTRVEACTGSCRSAPAAVRLDNPLKQGLKLLYGMQGSSVLIVRLDNPLKQGLKLVDGDDESREGRPPGQSIKTRVEAADKSALTPRAGCPPGQSIKTRVEAVIANRALQGRPVRLDNPLKQGLKLSRTATRVLRSMSAWTIH